MVRARVRILAPLAVVSVLACGVGCLLPRGQRYHDFTTATPLSQVSWLKKAFRSAHTKMDFDPEVWSRVEGMIVNAARTNTCADPAAPQR